jgi:hypothetical protein
MASFYGERFGNPWRALAEEQPHRSGRFKHPAIIQGLQRVFFSSRKRFGHVASCEEMPALSERLTPEAVAWICIVVRSTVDMNNC